MASVSVTYLLFPHVFVVTPAVVVAAVLLVVITVPVVVVVPAVIIEPPWSELADVEPLTVPWIAH